MSQLQSPMSLFLIIPLLLVTLWYFWAKNKKIATLQFSSVKIFTGLNSSLRSSLLWLPITLKCLGLIFAIIALARPQEANTKVSKNVEGIDIVIALDISDSMLIEDMQPLNRLEAAKEKIKDFVSKRVSDRIGLVIFAGEAFTLVPPTLDYPVLIQRIEEITTAQSARVKDGTAIGVALAAAAGRLKDSQAKSRIMVFMTDGENNSGTIDPETGLDIVKGYGIKVYSLGLGKSGPTKIPVYAQDMFGNKVKTYQPFESTVNEELLGRMATETGGKFWRVSRSDGLQDVFNTIDRLEKTKVDINKFTRYSELYVKWLLTGIVLYLIGIILGQTWLRRTP